MRSRSLLLVALLAAPAAGDEVVLVGGGRLSGEIVAETEAALTLRLPRGTMVVPRARVAGIVREERGAYLTREARRSLDDGALESAIELYEEVLALDGGGRAELAEALARHAEASLAAFRTETARTALARLDEVAPRHERRAELGRRLAAIEAEAGALLAHGRAALARRAFAEALHFLDRWRLHRPVGDAEVARVLATAHLAAARDAVERGVLRSALDHYRMAERYGARKESSEPLYLLRPVAVLEALKLGDLERARRLLDGIETTYPDRAVPVFLAAILDHVRGDVAGAVAAYAEAARRAEGAPPPSRGLGYDLVRRYATATLRAAIARPPEEGVATWRALFLEPLSADRGERAFVAYAASRQGARALAERARGHYERIALDLLGAVPDAPPAEIVLHPSRRSYLAADPMPPGTPLASVTLSREKTRGVCYDTIDADGRPLIRIELDGEAPDVLDDTLPHELVHLVQRQGLPAFRHGHWLDEGLATLYESAQGRASRLALWRTLRPSRLPLPELLELRSTPPDRAVLFYVQAHAFTGFLRGLGGEEDWRRFLAALPRAGMEDAVREAWGIESLAELERRWDAAP